MPNNHLEILRANSNYLYTRQSVVVSHTKTVNHETNGVFFLFALAAKGLDKILQQMNKTKVNLLLCFLPSPSHFPMSSLLSFFNLNELCKVLKSILKQESI